MRSPRPAARLSLFAGMLALIITTACTRNPSKSEPAPTTAAPSTTTSGSVSPSPTSSTGTIEFSDCSSQFRAVIESVRARSMQFDCGKLAAPLDYSKPTAGTVNLFVVRIHDKRQKAEDRIGSLLVNPGGPGRSGVNLAAGLVGALSDDIFHHFDLVGFDPRGVGLSDPLQCISDKQKDEIAAQNVDVSAAAGRAIARATADAVVRGCVAKYGTGLRHYNTQETARDVDLIRQAVGDTKLNYLGFSYGTALGAAYAHQFPTKIRTAVLDGPVDPAETEVQQDEEQLMGFEGAFDQFAADCTTRPACATLGDPRAVVTAMVKVADRAPIRSSKSGETRAATGGIVLTAVGAALYDQTSWATLGDALIAARKGDSAKLFALADDYNGRDPESGRYTNSLDAQLAVSCNDSTVRLSEAQIAAKAAEWATRYPIFGANMAENLYGCRAWPESGHPLPPASAPGAPPVLVIGTVHDPATPYAGASALAKGLGTGVVLSWDGEGHTAYPKTKCIVSKVDSYLITARIPAGNSCPRG